MQNFLRFHAIGDPLDHFYFARHWRAATAVQVHKTCRGGWSDVAVHCRAARIPVRAGAEVLVSLCPLYIQKEKSQCVFPTKII